MNIDTGGAAFPCHTNPRPGMLSDAPQGMTLRDYFAAKALQGLASNPSWFGTPDSRTVQYTVEAAYQLADAMLEARKHERP